jgi:hypothetical protein
MVFDARVYNQPRRGVPKSAQGEVNASHASVYVTLGR